MKRLITIVLSTLSLLALSATPVLALEGRFEEEFFEGLGNKLEGRFEEEFFEGLGNKLEGRFEEEFFEGLGNK